jgi:predicted type IV restriction endonuclease
MGESLEEVVATLVKKLDRWRGINEAQTSQVIILRLLKALGWDIWDPEEVKAQDSSSKSYRPDFLLNVNGKPAFVLEVKALDKTPTDEDRTQVVNYANSQNIRWAVLTTGRVWEFFDNKEEAKAPEKRVLLFQLDNPSAKEYLERTLSKSLWKEANASGKLSRIAKDIRKEIETQQSLTKIENILRKALEEGYQRSEKGLRKAIEKELSANDQELALSHFNVLLRRIL